jgi:hypothetical protein
MFAIIITIIIIIIIRKWLLINEKEAYKRIINCTNAVEWRNIRKYLYKIRCKWDNNTSNM